MELLLGARLGARTQRWQITQSQPEEEAFHLLVEILVENPNVGFPFKNADDGREQTRYQPRSKPRPRKGLFSAFVPRRQLCL